MSHDLSPLGFRKTPFTRELQVRDRFPLEPQAQVAAALTEAVQERMSAALIAPAGTGKTVALRMLVAALPEVRFSVHYVKVTGLSKRDLCKEIAVACGLISHRHLSRPGAQAAGRFRSHRQRRHASCHPARRSP